MGGGGREEGGIKMRVEILGERAEDLQSGSGLTLKLPFGSSLNDDTTSASNSPRELCLGAEAQNRNRGGGGGGGEKGGGANSKHWFTTPFLQPLTYLVTP